MSKISTVIKKEILDAMRDGKSMATAFFLPVILALVSFGTMQFIVSTQNSSQEITLAVQGANNIQPLIQVFEEAGIEIVEAPASPEEAIITQQYEMILIVPKAFNKDFRQQKTATLNLLSDHSRTKSQAKVAKVRGLIQHWSSHTGALRLISRNVSPTIASAVRVNDINVTSDERLASKILPGLPMFIMMIAFASGIGMISDMASGERERHALEPLLINPITHREVFIGKWVAAALVTFVISAIGVGLQFISVNLSPLAELGLRIDMHVGRLLVILLILIPVIALAVSMQLLVSFFARSFKDAQSYNSIIIMLPMLPGLYLTFNAGSAEVWQMFIPILGQTALYIDIIGGDGVSLTHLVVSSLSTLSAAVLCALLGIKLLQREKTIFG